MNENDNVRPFLLESRENASQKNWIEGGVEDFVLKRAGVCEKRSSLGDVRGGVRLENGMSTKCKNGSNSAAEEQEESSIGEKGTFTERL